jgi:TonB family protein
MRAVHGLFGAALLGAAAGPAEAAQTREHRERVGEWQVTAFTAGSCSAIRRFPTGTDVLIRSSSDGTARLAVLNRAWSMRSPGSYRLALVQSGTARSFAAEDDRTFQGLSRSTSQGAGFLAQLAAGGTVEVTAPNGTLLDRVDLGGVAPALARLGPCVTDIATAANFPPPGAPPPPPPPRRLGKGGKARPARGLAPLPQLFSSDDYPAAALRAEEEGAVGFRLDIGKDGRVAGCTVTGSSGSSALDSTTCALLTARARFSPALDRKGRPVADSFSGRIVWRIPEPEPEPPPPSGGSG